METLSTKIAIKIAWLLPPRVLLWALIRATSLLDSPPSGYEKIYDAIVNKYNIKD